MNVILQGRVSVRLEELSGRIHSDAADRAEHNNVIVIMENIVLELFATASIIITIAKSHD